MHFIEVPRPRVGWIRTFSLAVALLLTALFVGKIAAPMVFRSDTDQWPSVVVDCIRAPQGERLFGRMVTVPIGNPLVGQRTRPDKNFLGTARGQQIVVHRQDGRTNVIVRARGGLSPAQSAYLRTCARSVNW